MNSLASDSVIPSLSQTLPLPSKKGRFEWSTATFKYVSALTSGDRAADWGAAFSCGGLESDTIPNFFCFSATGLPATSPILMPCHREGGQLDQKCQYHEHDNLDLGSLLTQEVSDRTEDRRLLAR